MDLRKRKESVEKLFFLRRRKQNNSGEPFKKLKLETTKLAPGRLGKSS